MTLKIEYRNPKRFLVTFFGILFYSVNSFFLYAEEPVILSLDKSIEIAIRNTTAVLKGENELELSATQLLQSYAQFLPNLNAGANAYYTSGKTLLTFSGTTLLDARSTNGVWDLNSTLNLFNGLSDYAGLQSSLSRKSASELSLNWAKQQVAIDVTQTYLQTVLDELLLKIAQKNLALSLARFKQLEAQSQVGSATLADVYRQKAQASADELNVLDYEARHRNDQILLIRKIRIDPQKQYRFDIPSLNPEPLPEAKVPVDSLVEKALANRSDVQAAKEKTDYTDWDITRSKSPYFPRLDLVFDVNSAGRYLFRQIANGVDVLPPSQQSLISQLGNQITYTVTLGLTWNIFNRLTTRLGETQARLTRDNAQIDYTDTRLDVEFGVRVAHNDYLMSQRQVKTARVGVQAAQKAYDVVIGRFQVRSATFIDVLAAQSTLVQAQSSEVQSLVNLKLRERILEYVMGQTRIL
jgi:outer membrane protein